MEAFSPWFIRRSHDELLELTLVRMTSRIKPAALPIKRGGDPLKRLLRNDTLNFLIGFCARQLPALFRKSVIHHGQILLCGVIADQVLPEDLKRAQRTQTAHALGHFPSTSGFPTDLQQCLKSSTMRANGMYAVDSLPSRRHFASQPEDGVLIGGNRAEHPLRQELR